MRNSCNLQKINEEIAEDEHDVAHEAYRAYYEKCRNNVFYVEEDPIVKKHISTVESCHLMPHLSRTYECPLSKKSTCEQSINRLNSAWAALNRDVSPNWKQGTYSKLFGYFVGPGLVVATAPFAIAGLNCILNACSK